MSLPFSDTSTYKGIVQIYEKLIGANRTDISGNSNKLKELTADVNLLGWDEYLKLAFEASGTWQFDDSNQTDYPIITTNIVASQRDYSFTVDGTSNLILEIYKVAILPSATATLYQEILPIDAQSEPNNDFIANQTVTGTPYEYDKTSNGIFLNPIPSYSATSGLRVYINREASYFTSSDTTKKPGCPGIHHRWFALRPAEDYAMRNGLASYPLLRAERLQMEEDIKAFFGRRERDVRKRLTMASVNFE